MHKLSIGLKIRRIVLQWPKTFTFRDTRRLQMAGGVKRSNRLPPRSYAHDKRRRRSLETDVVWREVLRIKIIVMKYFEELGFGIILSCDIAWPSWLSLHSCSYGIFCGWVLYGLWATWIYNFLACYPSCFTVTLQSPKRISVWLLSTSIT